MGYVHRHNNDCAVRVVKGCPVLFLLGPTADGGADDTQRSVGPGMTALLRRRADARIRYASLRLSTYVQLHAPVSVPYLQRSGSKLTTFIIGRTMDNDNSI